MTCVARGAGADADVFGADQNADIAVLHTVRNFDVEGSARGQGHLSDKELCKLYRTDDLDAFGVAEPVIQQQGDDRIVVQLPGIQDSARARKQDILFLLLRQRFKVWKRRWREEPFRHQCLYHEKDNGFEHAAEGSIYAIFRRPGYRVQC